MKKSSVDVAMSIFFPVTITSMVLIDQPFKVAIIIGQVFGWISYLAAVIFVYASFKRKSLVILFFSSIIFAKFLRVVTAAEITETSYIVLQNCLFCIAGAIILLKRPDLLYKQVMVFCWMNIIVMFLQTSGIGGSLMQLFTTHGEANLTQPVNTLFVGENDIQYLLVQGRPAGLMDANVLLSLFILFAIGIHFSRSGEEYSWGTPLISAIIVLAMAKIAFLGFLIAVLVISFAGSSIQKRRITRAIVYVVLFFGLYLIVFPGLASVNIAKETIDASIFLRANEIMSVLNPDMFSDGGAPFFEGTNYFNWGEEGEFVSGVASVITKVYANLYLVICILAVGILLFVLGLKKIKNLGPRINFQVVFILLMVGLFPLTHPIWSRPVYWVMIGFGFLPFFYFFRPQFLKNTEIP